jgi:nucleotide-binding universal stress UspA family protein
MEERTGSSSYSAIQDFQRARTAANLERLLARLGGQSGDLLSYEEVRERVRAHNVRSRSLRDIPLDAIVGSVDRYHDFTRRFLPRRDSDQTRWVRVMQGTTSLIGLPPIEVYQIGSAYFVRDGNHRVSVARQMGNTTIEAYVTELQTRVPVTPDMQVDDLIIKAEYADFLERIPIDQIRPDADMSVSIPGRYRVLEEHIAVHRYYMGLEQEREISPEEAIGHWYDSVYSPVARVIHDRALLGDFPGRTETDLYLWAMDNLAYLREAVGWELEPTEAADRLAIQFSRRPEQVVARIGSRLLDAVTPDNLEGGPPAGYWRKEWLEPGGYQTLFRHVLVPVSGEERGWLALEQAIIIARREEGSLRGLHVTAESLQMDSDKAVSIRERFDRQCQAAGVPGKLVLETGKTTRVICDRSRWASLIGVNLTCPPGDTPRARLSSDFRTLLLRCARPVLAVPQFRPLDSLLLAYDGSPKAREGLFVAAYLAGSWEIPLAVLSVDEKKRDVVNLLTGAEAYLESRQVKASYLTAGGPAADAVLGIAQETGTDLIIMGGYGNSPVVEAFLGSTVDQVLRSSDRPVLICR